MKSNLELSVNANGSSGITILAKSSEAFNYAEFTLKADVPQPIFISPWYQFEPVERSDYRLKLAFEIARRAMVYDELLKEVDRLQKMEQENRQIIERMHKTQTVTFDMWKEDRAKMGLPIDFNDIKEWPPEMMSTYATRG